METRPGPCTIPFGACSIPAADVTTLPLSYAQVYQPGDIPYVEDHMSFFLGLTSYPSQVNIFTIDEFGINLKKKQERSEKSGPDQKSIFLEILCF